MAATPSDPAAPPPSGAPGARPCDARALGRHAARVRGQAEPPWLHAEVARRMAERLAVIRLQPATVLDWWAGSGASRAMLAGAYPQARRVEVEPDAASASAGPFALSGAASLPPGAAPSRWAALQRWTRRALRRDGSPEAWTETAVPAGSAQLVWANMMLHAEPDPPSVFARWHRALAIDGFLMFSTLGPGSLEALSSLFARAGWGPAFAPFVDMHDLGDQLVQAGFADPVMDQETLTLTWPDAEAALAELRTLGGNAAASRFTGLRTPRWRERLLRALEATAGADGRPQLGFEIVYGHAFRPVPRARVAAETAVALDDLRSMARRPRTRP